MSKKLINRLAEIQREVSNEISRIETEGSNLNNSQELQDAQTMLAHVMTLQGQLRVTARYQETDGYKEMLGNVQSFVNNYYQPNTESNVLSALRSIFLSSCVFSQGSMPILPYGRGSGFPGHEDYGESL